MVIRCLTRDLIVQRDTGVDGDVDETPTAGELRGGTAASVSSLQNESLGRGARLGNSNLLFLDQERCRQLVLSRWLEEARNSSV